jgi:phosphatidylserine/phosphatidylglycerophosphate/cardiolipin synthase-like enzyme
MRTRVRLLTLAAAALFVVAPLFAQAPAPIRAWFGPHPEGSPQGLDRRFIEFVSSAEKTLDGSFYEVRLDSLVDAFIAAHKKGVKVRLLIDDSNYYGKDEDGKINRRKRNSFAKKLIDAGIEVKQDKQRRALMHNKFAVVDGKRVWSGSYNLTDTCSYKNENNGLWMEDAGLAKIFTRQFEEMFVKEEFGKSRTSTLAEQKVKVGGHEVEVLFAPEDDPLSRQLELITKASKQVYFMQFAFTADEVADTLVAKSKAGVEVKGILDHRLYRSTGPYSEFTKLTQAGIPVVVFNKGDGKFHHKVFIVDPGTPQGCVITGSENTSNNGNEANDENVVIIRDPAIVDQYAKTFEALYGETSHTNADLVYGELPIAGGTIDVSELYVYGNGEAVTDVKVEFPPRWPISDETIGKLSVFVGDTELPKDSIKIEKKSAQFLGVKLARSGPRSLMIIRFTELEVPEIAGGYSPLVSVRGEGGGDYAPLAQQPTITVYPADSGAPMEDMFRHLRVMFHKLGRMETMPGAEVEKMRKAWEKDFARLRKSVVSAATNGRWPLVASTLTQLESLDAKERVAFGKLTDGARDLKRALLAKADQSEEAKTLLARLEKIASK